MYEPIQSGHKGILVFISIMTLLFTVVYSDHALGAGFKSEDELIAETRANVEKHLNGTSPVIKEEIAVEAPKRVEEAPIIREESLPAKEEQAPVVVEDKPATIEAPAVVQDSPPAKNLPVVQNPSPVAKSFDKSSGFRPEQPVVSETEPSRGTKKEEVPSGVIPVDLESNSVTKSDKESAGEDVEFVQGIKEPEQVKPLVEPVLKKMDVNKIGSSPYYETYEGLRLLKYFTVAQRVEIYQETRAVDAYIMDAFAMPKAQPNTRWNIKSDYRTQLTPIFTRSYGTEITMSNPKNKEGQIRYTHDYREIYRNYYPKYPEIKREMWDQNEILLMHSKQLEPIGWNYTSNLGYRYSTMNAKTSNPAVANEKSYYEIRHTYFGSLSLSPNEKLEWFGQAEYYKSMHVKSYYDTRPDHFLGRTEIRIKSNDMKTMYVPSFSYSKDYYYPLADTYQKYEIYFRVGRDFTNRFSATSTVKYVMGLRDMPDNTGPTFDPSKKNPIKDKAYTLALENRFSYNVYDRLYLQAGLDIANGLNWSMFDNLGLMGGLEYYAPGMIRVDFGWTGNYYYNLQDFLSSIYFKFYLFM